MKRLHRRRITLKEEQLKETLEKITENVGGGNKRGGGGGGGVVC